MYIDNRKGNAREVMGAVLASHVRLTRRACRQIRYCIYGRIVKYLATLIDEHECTDGSENQRAQNSVY